MHQGEIIEEIMGEKRLNPANDTIAPRSKPQRIQHTRCVLIVGTALSTFLQHIPQSPLCIPRHSITIHEQVCHVPAKEALIHLVNFLLMLIIRGLDIEVQRGNLRIVSLHLFLLHDQEIVTKHRKELQGIDLPSVVMNLHMK